MNFKDFFNSPPAPNLTTEKGPAAPSAPQEPSAPDTPKTLAPGEIPEKTDLAFFASLIKDVVPEVPGVPLSISGDILSPENMKKIVEAQDFSAHIPKGTLEKLQSGDQSAIMEAVEAMTRAAYSTALSQTGSIVDTVLAQREQLMRQSLQDNIMGDLSNREITKDIPGMDSPVVRQMAESVAKDLRAQFPKASPQQIRSMTTQYFAEINRAMNPVTPDPAAEKAAKNEVNWLEYAGFTH